MADTLLQKTLRQISESLSDSGEQGLPTEQPVVAEPDWEQAAKGLEAFLKQGQGGTSNADAVNRWIAEQAAQGREYIYDPQKDLAYSIAMNAGAPMMSGLGGPSYSSFDPSNPAASMAQVFRFNKEGANSINAPVPYRSGENYVLTDASGKNVLGRASSAEEMQQLVNLADAQKYGWNLYQGNEKGEYTPGAQLFGKADPRVGGLMGALIDVGLPLAMSFVPGIGWVGSAALAGAGSTAAGLMTGKTLGDALKSGAITAGTAGLLKGTGLDQTIGNALNKVPVVGDTLRGIGSAFAPSTSDAAARAAANEIVVTGAKSAAPGLVSGIAGSSLANAAPTTTQGPEPRRPDYGDKIEEPAIVVSAPRINAAANIIANGGTLADVINAGYTIDEFDAALNKYQSEEPGTTVVGEKPAPVPIPSFTPGPTDNVALPQDEIVVTRKNEQPVTGIDAIINSVAPSLNAPTMDVPAQAQDKGMSAGDYIRLAGLGASVLGALGGGGGGGSSLSTSGGGALNFTPTNRSFTGGGIGGGAGGSFDPFTYGQALPGAQTAEYLFFQPAANAGYQTTPAMAAPEAMPAYKDGGEVDDDMVRHLVEWHKGGGHTGPGKVKGIGSGQEDLIPAWLSDGEYVWSAQDVADLGDGSTDEGVRRLDKMRQMVRRRAGRKDVKKIAKPQRGIDTMLKAVGGSV